ncbi:MAG: spermidine synthase [Gemmatimonadaceae bacterium]
MTSTTSAVRWTPARANAVIGLFAVLIFVNATLLFVVQPMFTKMVLPLLGGTPSVWNTCLLFFQAALLLGYLYAHLTSQRLTPRSQGMLHLGLLMVALLFLPLGVPAGVTPPPGGALPVVWLLGVLAISLGLPFTLLAAGAPMFQRWFANTSHPAAGNPYVLYVASNLGSFVALLAYPTLIEPMLRLSEQRLWWLSIYVGLLLLIAIALFVMMRVMRGNAPVRKESVASVRENAGTFPGGGAPPAVPTDLPEHAPQSERSATVIDGASANLGAADTSPPDTRQADAGATTTAPRPAIVPTRAWRLRWVLLSFAPSSLLLGVTAFLSTDVAAVPLLWVIPLALYLLTFVIVFAERPLLGRKFMLVFQLFIGLALLLVMGMTPTRLRVALIALHLLGFFATAMVCHRELADSRPRPEHLTEFYLWMSLGGMLGGLFNVVLAPLIYDRVLEYPYALIIAFGLRPGAGRTDTSRRQLALDLVFPLALYLGLLASFEIQLPAGKWGNVVMWVLFGAAGLVVASFYKRPLRVALSAAALFMAVDRRGVSSTNDLVHQTRSFFGVYRIHKWNEFLVLQHGTTTHGAQSLISENRRVPLTYYAREGPLGDAFAVLTDSTAMRNVALVGLGTGTTACYARPEERWTYYEIDPVVVQLALSGRFFTYIQECGPEATIRLGDARLSLVRAPDSSFDLIVLDAFSSDAIPVHLMTREAVRLYLRKLKPDGALLFHISNRYLNLEPVLSELARDARLAGAARDYDPSEEDRRQMLYASRWVALGRTASALSPLVTDRGWRVLAPQADVRLWTDDFSDIVGVLRRE